MKKTLLCFLLFLFVRIDSFCQDVEISSLQLRLEALVMLDKTMQIPRYIHPNAFDRHITEYICCHLQNIEDKINIDTTACIKYGNTEIYFIEFYFGRIYRCDENGNGVLFRNNAQSVKKYKVAIAERTSKFYEIKQIYRLNGFSISDKKALLKLIKYRYKRKANKLSE